MFDEINWILGNCYVPSSLGFRAIFFHAKEHQPRVTTIHLRSVTLVTVRGRRNDAPGVATLIIVGGYGIVARHKLGSEDECKSWPYFGRAVRLHADHNKYRIRIDHLLDLASSFLFEFSEGSDTKTVGINRLWVKTYKYRMHPRRWHAKI